MYESGFCETCHSMPYDAENACEAMDLITQLGTDDCKKRCAQPKMSRGMQIWSRKLWVQNKIQQFEA